MTGGPKHIAQVLADMIPPAQRRTNAHLQAVGLAIDGSIRHLAGQPETTSDALLLLADQMRARAFDDSLPPAEALLWHRGAERACALAPIYAGRALRPGCTAGMGGE